MLVEMPTVARCCFCAPLRYGLLVWAYLKLIGSIIALWFLLIFLVVVASYVWDSNVMLIFLSVTTVLVLIVDVVFNFLLIVGAHKKNTSLLTLHYRYAIAYPILFVTLGLLWILFTVEFKESEEQGYLIAVLIVVVLPLILHIYLFIVLRSEIFKIRAKYHFDVENLKLPEHTEIDKEEEEEEKEETTVQKSDI